MIRFVIAALLLFCTSNSWATLLGSWNLKLSTLGGSDAILINTVTLNGFSAMQQSISGNVARGQSFSFTGSVRWVQYQRTGLADPLKFALPAGQTDLYFRFENLSGVLGNNGNATFTPGTGSVKLYLDSGGSLVPGSHSVLLATYSLASASAASDIAYHDGGGAKPMINLNLQLKSATPGLFTDSKGATIQPSAIFSVEVDGLLDPTVASNPTPVSSGTGLSTNTLINAGSVNAVNVIIQPPDCSHAGPTIASLWPPNHKMVKIGILGVIDPNKYPLSIVVTSIQQDEPVDINGSGHTEPDGTGVGTSIAQVRAERSGTGTGRIYFIGFSANNGQGGTCNSTVQVYVPHDQGQHTIPIDTGQRYDSTK